MVQIKEGVDSLEQKTIFTTDELAVLLATVNYGDAAARVSNGKYESLKAKELDGIFDAAVNQLRMKGIWDEEKHQLQMNPVREETMMVLSMLAEAPFYITISDFCQDRLLVLHYVNYDKWLHQYVIDGEIHEFHLMDEEAIPEILKGFYGFAFSSETVESASFYLDNKSFDLLHQPKKSKKIVKRFKGTEGEKESFETFMKDLSACNHSVDNITVFMKDKHSTVKPVNTTAFVKGQDGGVWMSRYEHDKHPPLKFFRAQEDVWEDMLKDVLQYTQSLINESTTLQTGK